MPATPEAAQASASCLFSLGTLEVARLADLTIFTLIEREHSGVWRWAIIGFEGRILDDSRELSLARAKKTAEDALRLVAA